MDRPPIDNHDNMEWDMTGPDEGVPGTGIALGLVLAVFLWVGLIALWIALTAPQAEAEPVIITSFASSPHVSTNTHTHVELHAPTTDAAVATLTFRNRSSNHHGDNGDYVARWADYAVGVRFTWNASGGHDRIDVSAPAGYAAVPPSLTLPELESGEVHIMKFEGM